MRQRDYLDYLSEPNAITRALASKTGRQQSETERELAALGDGLEDEDGARAQKLRSRTGLLAGGSTVNTLSARRSQC